jgi:hypothetical protein
MNSYTLPHNRIFKPCGLLLAAILFCTGLMAQKTYTTDDVRTILLQEKSDRIQDADFNELEITAQYTDEKSGLTHVYVQQQYQGIPIVDAQGGLHFDGTGKLAYHADHFTANLAQKTRNQQASLSAAEAVEAALGNLGVAADKLTQKTTKNANSYIFEQTAYTAMDIPARLVYIINRNGDLTLAWEVGIYTLDENNYWQMYLDARSGRELNRQDLVIHCQFSKTGSHDHTHGEACELTQPNKLEQMLKSTQQNTATTAFSGANFYRVYDAPIEAPTFGERTLVGASGDPTASPLGWHNDGLLQYNITKGNNVYAYQDPGPLSTGIPAVGGLPGQQPLVFDFDADLSLPPLTFRDAAITNLFYWNNLIHDIFYPYGFTEAAGNFQWSNFGRGGAGNDAVLAEAQDGSGVDNANFLTLADGLPGRMQMFLWTGVPLIDGDFDNGVILHEYGHGISTRLTGGPAATCLGGDEQSGEGWSDFFGYMITMNPNSVPAVFAEGRGIGSYVFGEAPDGDGIRPARYSTDFSINDYTYGDLNNSEISAPHGVGFIWATMLWEMTAKLVDAYGYDTDIVNGNGGNNIAIQLVMTGLKLQPCSPTFVEQRDAILAADQLLYGGANKCLIWEAFAKRGLGFSAQSGTNGRGDETEAFDMPATYCLPSVEMTTEVVSLASNGGTMDVQINIINNAETAIGGIEVTEEMPAGTTVVNASDSFVSAGNELVFSGISVPANSTYTITVTLSVNTPSQAEMLLRDDLEDNPFGWTVSPGLNQFVWTTEDAFSGNYSFKTTNPDNFSNLTLTWNEPLSVTSVTHLRFAHRFNTEENFDGGMVEVSNDDGITWTDLGPLFVENGYNNFVAVADNPLINGFCFGGNSGAFIHSMADLSPFAGQTLRLRYRFASDVLTAAEGWFIDDVELVNDPYTVTNTASFSMANGAVTGQATDEILILDVNNTELKGQSTTPQAVPSARNNTLATVSSDFELAPNPSSTQVQIFRNNWTEGAALRVMDARGQVMYTSEMNNKQQSLDVSNWPAGIYLVQIQEGDNLVSKKLIVE